MSALDLIFKNSEAVQCFNQSRRHHPLKGLAKIGVSNASGRKSESDYLKLHNKLLLQSNPPAVNSRLQQARYKLNFVEASA
jgi:hypothetical protein